ncbi:cofilin [Mortierella sp. AD094]|nr:cofilin [Mortierella sp. AD094]
MSAPTGVQLNPECVAAFQELKAGKIKYVIYKISDDQKSIIVETKAKTATYDQFLTRLPTKECRWAVYDFDYKTAEGARSKIVFYTWSPDDAVVKSKMLYAASKDTLRRPLTGIQAEIQGTSFDEVSYATVLEKISRR